MKPANYLENLVKNVPVTTRPEFDRQVLSDAAQALSRSIGPVSEHDPNPSLFRRITMKNTWKKFAVAAAVLVIFSLFAVFAIERSAIPAYAIEQTIAANHSVRYIHIVNDDYQDEKNGPGKVTDIWAQFDDLGQLVRCRAEIPQSEDGPKSVTWQDNKAQVWLRAKKCYVTINNRDIAQEMVKMVYEVDPQLGVQHLQDLQVQGKVTLDISEPQKPTDPIILTATYLPNSDLPNARWILFINSTTKLVSKIERYKLNKDGSFKLVKRQQFLDYNQPIDDKTLVLDVPADVIRVDQTVQDIGLPQGSLTKEEIAVKIVREFCEAWMVDNYEKMGKLMGGVPAGVLAEKMRKLKLVRIVSLGKPEPHQPTQSLRVPCTVELEGAGKKTSVTFNGPFVRQVDGRPDRWCIIGGI